MEQFINGFTLDTPAGTFPLSTDSILLAHFARLPKNASVLDLGAGCGTLGVLLCGKDTLCQVTGIEISKTAHLAAVDNIHRNHLQDRMESICADLREINTLVRAGSFDCCISNPPYFSGGPASQTLPEARRDDLCSPQQLMEAAARALRFGGDFFFVHKPEKLALMVTCAANAGLEPKRLCTVYHHPGSEISLIMLSCRKGAKPGLLWEQLYLFDENGAPTQEYKKIYHL